MIFLPQTLSRPSDIGTLLALRELCYPQLFSAYIWVYTVLTRKAASEEQEAQSVTEGLVELRQMMHGQVQHAQGALGVLGNATCNQQLPPLLIIPMYAAISSGKLQETKSGMEEIGSNIKVGQGLISKLGRRDITDKVLIFLAFIFFISVVLYVIRKRIIGWII